MLTRAARSAAAAASRFARFHEPAALSLSTKAESHAPATSDCAASGHSSAVAVAVAVPPPVTAAPASTTVRHLKDQKPEGRVKFMAEEKDLESDEALWALYERWCKAFDQERDREEMARRFDRFKKTVLDVQHINKAYPSHKPRTINKFADGKLMPPCGCSRSPLLKRMAEELNDNPCELIVGDDDKLYKRVFADYKVVDDRLYVHLPKGIDVKTITTNPEWPTSEC